MAHALVAGAAAARLDPQENCQVTIAEARVHKPDEEIPPDPNIRAATQVWRARFEGEEAPAAKISVRTSDELCCLSFKISCVF